MDFTDFEASEDITGDKPLVFSDKEDEINNDHDFRPTKRRCKFL